MTFARPTKEDGRQRVIELVNRYRPLANELTNSGSIFTETETRSSYIDPLLEALGWDVRNLGGRSQRLTEVVMERVGADSGGAWGRPDYRLRLGGGDVMPVEAKKPSVPISQDSASAVQARSYGWSLSLPAGVLTNFDELVVFDTTIAPIQGDAADIAALPSARFKFEEYVSRFDELWRLLSFESLDEDGIENVYSFERPPRGQSPFDRRFLGEFRKWRHLLAQAIAIDNPGLGGEEVGRRTQRLLNALLFLRVCEDRNIGQYEDLLQSANASRVVESFRSADRAFNAGLFTVLKDTTVAASSLAQVIREMYWPRTQFAFGVLEPKILAGVYEQYLAERVVVAPDRSVVLEQKPEIAHAGGVVSTPDFVVRALGDATIDPLLSHGLPAELPVLDLSCGSGVFLLDAFDRLLEAHDSSGALADIEARGQLAKHHLFGVDIDGAAVEVTKLGLLLAVLGDDYLDPVAARNALPDLTRNIIHGNGVVRENFDAVLPTAASDPSRRARVIPLNLANAIGPAYPATGFKAILGNPPYVRIQVMSEFMADQLEYFQNPASGYESPLANNFDLYQLFVERALGLLAPDGRMGYIIPNRFTNLLAATGIRNHLTRRIERLIHFGEEQLFPGRTTYSAIAIIGPVSVKPVTFELVSDLADWVEAGLSNLFQVPRSDLGPGTWPISTAEQAELFRQLTVNSVGELGDDNWVDIFVGVQTSADDYFFIKPTGTNARGDRVTFVDRTGVVTEIEKPLLRLAIRDQKIDFYDGQPDADCQVIFPYEVAAGARPTVIAKQRMEDEFPLAFAYFERHRHALESERNISPNPGEQYWAFGRSQSLGKLDDPKLIVRVLSLTPQYALDSVGLVVPGGGDGGPYYLLRPRTTCIYSMEVIQAILSHPAVDLFVAVTGKRYRGSYASHRKAFLSRVPLPRLSDLQQTRIAGHVAEMQRHAVSLRTESDSNLKNSLKARRRYLAEEIEEILTGAYGLDSELYERLTGAT